jgi:hypothetical protein
MKMIIGRTFLISWSNFGLLVASLENQRTIKKKILELERKKQVELKNRVGVGK